MSDENFQVKFFLFQISSEKFSEIIENSYTVVNYKKDNSYYTYRWQKFFFMQKLR